MASAPGVSAIILLITGLLSLKQNFKTLINDKLNLFFIFLSTLMPLIAWLHNDFLEPTDSIIPLINNWEKSLSWIGLANWLPLFFSFVAFQNFLKFEEDRLIFGKCLIAGIFPIIISGFSQFIFGVYGPFEFLNGFIIWFQKPILPMEGISAVFSNQNYAGAWFCVVFPFCLASFLDKRITNSSRFISLVFLILISSSLVLTSSRSAWIGLLSFIPLIFGITTLFWILPLLLLVLILVLMANGLFVSADIQTLLRDILPRWLWLKFSSENYTYGLSRFEIWEQAITLINQKPLIGWGAAAFPLLYYSAKKVFVQHPHNLFFELGISYGLPFAILLFISIFLICIKSYFRVYVSSQFNKINLNDRAWFSSFIVLFSIQMVDIQYFDGRISLIFWILLAGLKQINQNKLSDI